jgi:4-carboxymuconolactone decarboxylase
LTRIALVSPDTSDPDVAPVFARLKHKWGEVLNLYRALAWSPPLTRAWGAFASSLRFDVGASRRLREVLVVQIALRLGATYEYEHHKEMARDEGLTDAQLRALPDWHSEPSFDADERLMLSFADELATGTGASADTMRALRERFGERDLMEFLVTGAFYCGVARVINSLDLELEAGHAQLRPKKD